MTEPMPAGRASVGRSSRRAWFLQGWPLVLGVLGLSVLLVLVGAQLIPAPANPPEGYTSWDWWYRGVMAVVYLGVAWLAGVRIHFSNRVPYVALLLILPMLITAFSAKLSADGGGLLHPDLLRNVVLDGLMVAASEEVACRGLMLNALAARMSAAWAVFMSSALFAGVHLIGGDPGAAVVPMILGLGLGWVYVLAGRNLWLVIGLHALFDIALFVVVLTKTPEHLGVYAGMILTLVGAVVVTVIGLIRWRRVRL